MNLDFVASYSVALLFHAVLSKIQSLTRSYTGRLDGSRCHGLCREVFVQQNATFSSNKQTRWQRTYLHDHNLNSVPSLSKRTLNSTRFVFNLPPYFSMAQDVCFCPSPCGVCYFIISVTVQLSIKLLDTTVTNNHPLLSAC